MDHWMFHCQDVTEKVSESMDRDLPLHQWLLIRMHLLMCRYCTRFHRQLHLIRQAVHLMEPSGDTFDPAAALSAEARKRIKHALGTASD